MSNRHKRPRSRLTPACNDIAEILGQDRFGELLAISQLRRAWADIVGPMMAVRTEPVSIEKDGDVNCLWIAVDHPIMSQQIRFLRDDIRKACFKRCRIESLAKVRTRVQSGAGIKPKKNRLIRNRVSLSDKKRVASELESIKNRTLKRAIFDARIAQLRYSE
ncbi:MAG: DciA family protein [Mariprofundaceae bacterium]|nr:DciA family protein [Mariprofundaceae bacterium]